jgi:L-alanine-DL-glutamate epimerase-like enolase superfamily enzyme
MLKVKVAPIQLHLKHPFTLAHGSSMVRENVFIEMEMDGYTAYGEAPIVPYYFVSKEEVVDDIIQTISSLRPFHIMDMIEKRLFPIFRYATSSAAFQTAALNLYSAISKKSTSEIFEISIQRNPPKTTYTIAYHKDVDMMVDIASSCGFSHLKIKAGIPGDIIRIKAIRAALPSAKIFVDANQGWSVEEAKNAFKQLEGDRITLIEEPFKGSPEEIEELARATSIPLFLDESIQNEDDLLRFVHKAPHLKGIVVKSSKVKGPYGVKKIIDTAKEHNLKVFLSSMVESSVGIASVFPCTHVADYVDLDGPLLIANAPFSGLRYENERLCFDDIGIKASDDIMSLFHHTPPILLKRI